MESAKQLENLTLPGLRTFRIPTKFMERLCCKKSGPCLNLQTGLERGPTSCWPWLTAQLWHVRSPIHVPHVKLNGYKNNNDNHSKTWLRVINNNMPWVHWTLAYHTSLSTLEGMEKCWISFPKNKHCKAVEFKLSEHTSTRYAECPLVHNPVARTSFLQVLGALCLTGDTSARSQGLHYAGSPAHLHINHHIALYHS